MGAFESMFKKIKSITTHGIKPYEVGKNNFNNPVPEVERTAEERAKICAVCPVGEFTEEPIKELQVVDERIPSLSAKMCGDCGCTSSYLLRQNIKICKQWPNQ